MSYYAACVSFHGHEMNSDWDKWWIENNSRLLLLLLLLLLKGLPDVYVIFFIHVSFFVSKV